MGLKQGYRVTDVGTLPAEWGLVPFSELLEFRNGVNADKAAYGAGVRFINVLEVITKSHLSASDIPGRISLSEKALAPYTVRRGDVVFNRTSETQEEVGLAAVYNDDELVVFGGFVIRGRPTMSSEALDPLYSGYALRSKPVRRQVIARGQGAIRANIGQQDLRSVLVPRPPLPEQQAIAAALSDVDALLSALDQLIGKKRDLKHAAVQQLLSGQTRLPGFSGKWETKTVDEVAQVTSGKRLPLGSALTATETPHPYIRVSDMRQGTVSLAEIMFVPVEVFPAIARYRIFKEDLFISVAGTLGIVGKIPQALDGANLTENADRITDITCSRDFLLHVLMAPTIQNAIASSQTVGAQPKLALARIRKFEIRLPPTTAEQEAIAEVLGDMDEELTALDMRRAKTRLLKQGLMQELLIGKTRLV